MQKRIFAASLVFTLVTGALAYRKHHWVFAAGPLDLSTNIEALTDGHVQLSVVNTSNLPITALAAVGTRTLLAKPATDRSVRFFDSVLNPFGPRELGPGKTYTFNFFGPNPPPDQLKRDVQLRAAIFADGSTWGDQEWITTLLLRRSSAHLYNAKILKTIEQTTSAGIPLQQLIQKLSALQKDDFDAAKTTAEKQMVQAAYEEALILLQSRTRANGDTASLPEATGQTRSRLFLRVTRLEASKPPIAN